MNQNQTHEPRTYATQPQSRSQAPNEQQHQQRQCQCQLTPQADTNLPSTSCLNFQTKWGGSASEARSLFNFEEARKQKQSHVTASEVERADRALAAVFWSRGMPSIGLSPLVLSSVSLFQRRHRLIPTPNNTTHQTQHEIPHTWRNASRGLSPQQTTKEQKPTPTSDPDPTYTTPGQPAKCSALFPADTDVSLLTDQRINSQSVLLISCLAKLQGILARVSLIRVKVFNCRSPLWHLA